MPEEEEEKVEETVESVAAFLSPACIAHTPQAFDNQHKMSHLHCTASHHQVKSRKLYLLHKDLHL